MKKALNKPVAIFDPVVQTRLLSAVADGGKQYLAEFDSKGRTLTIFI